MQWLGQKSPFLDERHRDLAARVVEWASRETAVLAREGAAATRPALQRMAEAGLLDYAVPPTGIPDVRALCVIREVLAYHSATADAAFAVQGSAAAPIAAGCAAMRDRYLPGLRGGTLVASLANPELHATSGLEAATTSAVRQGDRFILNGNETWVRNGGIADVYVVFARTVDAEGQYGSSAFVVDADTPGLQVRARETLGAHPVATLQLRDCTVPESSLLGPLHAGSDFAMRNFENFGPTAGACAIGYARRAYDAAVRRMAQRNHTGTALLDTDAVQLKLADMLVGIETAALAVHEAAWALDTGKPTAAVSSSIAKLVATEWAQQAIDQALQLFGAEGLSEGCIVERLYRCIRALRIEDGASETRSLAIAKALMQQA